MMKTITDPSQQLVPAWVSASFPPVDSFFTVTKTAHGEITAWHCDLDNTHLHAAAWRLAVGLAARRLATRPDTFFSWFSTACDCSDSTDARLVDLLRVPLLIDVGTPTDVQTAATRTRYYGLVAETLLFELLATSDRGLGLPLMLEAHGWSVQDPGGDHLAIYGSPSAGLAFRLWESKAIQSTIRTPNAVVKDAADQLEKRATEYIGRFAAYASRTADDPELAAFLCQMPELWANDDPRGGLGIGVATATAPTDISCFEQLAVRFTIPNTNKSGNLTIVGDLDGFAAEVQRVLWKGAGPWIAP